MSTKEVHLEAVSNLSATAFIAALDRFIAWRGYYAHLKSDNGINFKGAERELRNMFRAASEFFKDCRSQLQETQLLIQWFFIPPSVSHFGDLWEAGIMQNKSVSQFKTNVRFQ